MKMKEKSLKTQMISNELVLSVMKPSVVLWNFPSIFIRNILRILPTLFAHSAPSTLGKDTFYREVESNRGCYNCRAQPDWAYEFPDRIGLDTTGHSNLRDRSWRTGPNPDLYF